MSFIELLTTSKVMFGHRSTAEVLHNFESSSTMPAQVLSTSYSVTETYAEGLPKSNASLPLIKSYVFNC